MLDGVTQYELITAIGTLYDVMWQD